jgi:Fe-S-cluster containining protein
VRVLEDGVCTAYEARPTVCRKYHSVSVKTCHDAFMETSAPLTGEIEDEQVRLAGADVQSKRAAQGFRPANTCGDPFGAQFRQQFESCAKVDQGLGHQGRLKLRRRIAGRCRCRRIE